MEKILMTGGYAEVGEKLCAAAFKEYLEKLPQYSHSRSGCSYHDYVFFGRYEEAFADLAGIMWKNGKRFSDEILDLWEAFLDEFQNPFRERERGFAYEGIKYQRAISKE